MASITHALKSFAEPKLYLDALYITAGFVGSSMLGGLVGSRLPLPGVLQPFVGPALVIVLAAFIGDGIGRGLKLGAFVHVTNTLLQMVGLRGIAA